MRAGSLSSRLLLFILPTSLVAVGLISLSTYSIARRVILWESQQGIVAVTQSAAAEAKAYFEQRHADLATISQSPLFKDHYSNVEYGLKDEASVYREEIERMLGDLASRAKAYQRLSYLDARGREVCGVGDGLYDDKEFFSKVKALREGQRLVSPILRAPGQDTPVVRYGTPLRDELGKLRGALVFTASLGPVYDSLASRRLGLSGRVFLSQRRRAAEEKIAPSFLTAEAPIAGTPWVVETLVDRGDFLGPLAEVSFLTLFLAFIGATFLTLALTRETRRLMSPVSALAAAAGSYARGKLDVRVTSRGDGEVAALADAFNAMADSLEARTRALVESEARYRSAVENSPNANIGLDQNFRVTLWNRRAEALFDYQPTEAYGRELSFLLGDEAYAKLKRKVETEGSIRQAEVQGKARDGRLLDLNMSWTGQAASPGTAREWYIVIQDVTERKKLQAQLVQAEKMTALGNLTAGIAHELNNPLGAVTGFAEILSHELKLDPKHREDFQHLFQSAMRCRDIVQGLLLYTRKMPSDPRRLSLNYVVQSAVALFEYRLSRVEGIELEVELDAERPEVAGEFQKLLQVLVNLVANAHDALRGRLGRKTIRVRTRKLAAGCEVSVEDNGPGVPDARKAAIFEPFYTTKAAGKGTGLGLPISRQIAEEFGGQIASEDAPGGGARFVATFPACPAGLREPDAAHKPPPAAPGGRVLIVDDEPQLVSLMTRLLSEDGVHALVAGTAEEGRAILAREKVDLVIADIDLGPVKGTELLYALKDEPARPAFLFVTGDILNRSMTEELAALDAPVLIKPFLRTEFLRLARRALAARLKAG